MTFEVSVIAGVAKRTLVSDTDTAICISSSSRSLRISPTVLRGTITPGMFAAPSGKGASIRASRCPSVATQRRTGPSSRLGHMHVDAVEVIARLLGRDGEFRLVEQPPEDRRGGREIRRVFRRRHYREIFLRQCRERKHRAPGLHREPPGGAVIGELHERAVGQLAHDLVQHHRRNRGRSGALDLGGGLVHHLDVEVGGAEARRYRRRPRSARWQGSGSCCVAPRPIGPDPPP